MSRWHQLDAPTDTPVLNAVQQRSNGDDEQHLCEGVGPELVSVPDVCEQQDAVDMQHERAK